MQEIIVNGDPPDYRCISNRQSYKASIMVSLLKIIALVGLVGMTSGKPQVLVKVKSLKGFNADQALRFIAVANNTQVVINSDEFRSAIVTHTWKSVSTLTDTTDTPFQVFAKITAADWNLARSTIGYTYPDVSWIAINSRKWDSLTDADISGNICHEYGGHKFGKYSHSMKWTASRDHSAPYWIGDKCREVYSKLFR